MRTSLGLSFLEIGTILSVGLVATMTLQPLAGTLSDMGHARTLLLAGFSGLVIVDLAFPISSVFLQVLLLYVLLRSAASVYHPVSFAAIGRTYSGNKAAAFGYQGAVGDFGLGLAAFSTGVLSQVWGWEASFLVWGSIGAAIFVYFAATIATHKVTFYSRLATSVSQTSYLSESRSVKSTFALIALASSLTTTSFLVFMGYMPLYFNVVRGLTPSQSTAIVAVWIGIGVVAGLMTGRVSSRLGGEVRALQLMFAFETVLLLVASYMFSRPAEGLSAQLVGYLALALTGIPVFVTFPAVNALLGVRMPHRRLGLTYAVNQSLGLLAASVVTYAIGYLASTMSIGITLPVLLVVAVIAAITSFTL